eukprot:Pgem_evm1s6255
MNVDIIYTTEIQKLFEDLMNNDTISNKDDDETTEKNENSKGKVENIEVDLMALKRYVIKYSKSEKNEKLKNEKSKREKKTVPYSL